MEHKTLIILSPAFPKDEADSTWIPPQQQFVKALKNNHPNLNIVVLSFQYPHIAGEYWWNGVKVIAFGGQGRGRLFRLYIWLNVWWQLKKLKRQHQVTGILSFWLNECALIGHYFSKLHHLKHYIWLLGQDAKAGNRYAHRVKPKAEQLIALSDFIFCEYHKNYGVKPKYLIPVGITPTLFERATGGRDIDILGVGSLIPLKQFEVLVQLVSVMKLYKPGVRAVICGGGIEKARLNAQIAELNLQDNLILTGETAHAEVLRLMQRSKVLVHPSAYEGFGMVCLEALYAGAQVVSFVKPMDAGIANWHIVATANEMLQKVQSILSDKEISHLPVMPYPIADNVRAMMQLYDYSDDAM